MTMRATSAGEIAAFPSATSTNACGRVLEVDVLDEVAHRTGTEGAEEIPVFVRDREHHDLGRRQSGGDLPGRSNPAARHPDIEQANVGSRLERLLYRAGGVGCLRAHDQAAVR